MKTARACGSRVRCHAAERGAVALEYILIAALVAIALIGAFRSWGDVVEQQGIRKVAVVPLGDGALEEVD